MVGRVLSIFTMTETEFDRPAPLVALQVRVVPEVSVVSVVVSLWRFHVKLSGQFKDAKLMQAS